VVWTLDCDVAGANCIGEATPADVGLCRLTSGKPERRPIRATRFERSARLCRWSLAYRVSQVLDLEPAQCLGVAARSEANAVVGRDTLHLNAMGPEEAQRVKEKAQAGATFFVGQDFGVSDARVVVDGQMQVFPADPTAVALTLAVAGDAVADLRETAELFDIDVNDFAGMFALIAANRLGWLQRREPVEATTPEDTASEFPARAEWTTS
jgi:hypothetical protein